MTKRFICTWAQNATPVHPGFLAALKTYCRSARAQLVVIPGRYKNPTSQWTDKDETDDWWASEVARYLNPDRQQLCPNLALFADISIQPTAVRPLTGFEVFCGSNSAIFGHPKRALETIPTATRMPRLLVTTGAVTVANYTRTKAGKKAEAHHVLGALVVEIDNDGCYFMRHVSADAKTGSFYDLDKKYTSEGVQKAKPALALALGDLHVGRDDAAVLMATKELIRLTRPRNLFLHDSLDFASRNHHSRGLQDAVTKAGPAGCVRTEVADATATIADIADWGKHIVRIVRSNHDSALDKWLNETSPHSDPQNARYWVEVWARMFAHKDVTGKWPMAFAMEAQRLGVPKNVRFLELNEDVQLGGVHYGFHGHVGTGGSRGSPQQYAKLGVKTTTGHTHKAQIIDGAYVSGVTADLDHGYNALPSAWLQAHTLQYADGKRAIIVVVRGRFRGTKKELKRGKK